MEFMENVYKDLTSRWWVNVQFWVSYPFKMVFCCGCRLKPNLLHQLSLHMRDIWWKTEPECVHLLMWSPCTLATLCSFLQLRHAASQHCFIPAFPESSVKGHKGCLFCVSKETEKNTASKLHCCFFSCQYLCKSPSAPISLCVCVTDENKGVGGRGVSKESGGTDSRIPAQASLACCRTFPVYSCSHSRDMEVWSHLAAACQRSCIHVLTDVLY